MRMRRKKHGAERIAACAHLLIENPADLMENPSAPFGVIRPLRLEIGCGKGAFAVSLAAREPDVNIIALERVSDVACIALEAAEAAREKRPADNLRFIIGDAREAALWFPPHSLERIYLNFSDPWPKSGYAKRRLTHASFLGLYRQLLIPGGTLVLKTDNTALFDFSLEQFKSEGLTVINLTRDLHASEYAAGNIMTEYERNFAAQGARVCSVTALF